MQKEGTVVNDMKAYMFPRYPRAARLKGNPKLHKENKPLRTIVSGISTPTECIAEVAEKELNEFVIASSSYVRDTTDFLNKLNEVQEPLPENSIIFTMDVEKLYPSVPKIEGLKACEKAL